MAAGSLIGLIGAQRAVWWGGILIMVGNGHCWPWALLQLFFLGIVFIAFGVGLLKPNISAIVAQIYPEGGSRRDAGFSIFYMGINIGDIPRLDHRTDSGNTLWLARGDSPRPRLAWRSDSCSSR